MADDREKLGMNLCNVCGMAFKRRYDLRRHERHHEGKGVYHCCGRAFRDNSAYTLHRCTKHGKPTMFSCDKDGCKSSFATNYALRRHIHVVHVQGARRFSCDECNKQFWYQHQLSEHVAIKHEGEKKCRCSECGKTYVYRSGLSRHRKSCAKKTGNNN